MECVVYGVGSPVVYELVESLRRLAWPIRGFVSNIEGGFRPDDLEPLVDVVDLPKAWRSLPVVFALITPAYRQQLERETRRMGFRSFPTVLDPTVVAASSSSIGEGSYVNAGTILGANTRIGRFTAIQRMVSVGHDAVIEDYASLSPGVIVLGSVRVCRGAFVGAGAVLNPGTTIGENALVGSGAVVLGDIAAHTVVAGNPARVLRDGHPGYGDASVTPGP